MALFDKILIANRGEIAIRVIRTARRLGYRTVAVYSEADSDALHITEADEAVCLGNGDTGEPYLHIEKIIHAAQLTDSGAIHPGYGFLSENADFCRACNAASITFIGPGADAIELMGSKRLSKIAMQQAGVPCIPGYEGEEQSVEALIAQAKAIGFPLMIKASAGGGGRGMRLVNSVNDLAAQIKTARSEALNAFGSGELILERAVIDPRHIEIQVFADNYGNVVYLGERDCSIQRRHQKVVEEAPSPAVDDSLREKMGEAAVNAARSCQYRGAGTVEFLLDKDKNFYFLEMNTRLQVEHPVTEMITGLDLVEWQLRVAAGETLPLKQQQITLQGHAIEVRLYAEDPRKNFMPQTGKVLTWHTPQSEVPPREGVRVDYGIQTGQLISPFYDPMLAKIIAFGENRTEAARRLTSAVQDCQLLGVNSNKLFLQNVLRHPIFVKGEATTAFIEKHFSDDVSISQSEPGAETVARAALLYFSRGEDTHRRRDLEVWSSTAARGYNSKLSYEGTNYDVLLTVESDTYKLTVKGQAFEYQLISIDGSVFVVIEENVRRTHHYRFENDTLYLDDGSGHFVFDTMNHKPVASGGAAGSGQIKAPMDGAIIDVLVSEGQSVEQGQTLAVLEAMKMEHPLKAAFDGTVSSINIHSGQQVKSKQLLITISDSDEQQQGEH